MDFVFCPVGETRDERVYISVEEINRHTTGLTSISALASAIATLLKRKALAALVGGAVTIALLSFGQAIAYALTNHGIKGFDVTFHYKCKELRAWDTDQWVDFVGWDLVNVTIEERY